MTAIARSAPENGGGLRTKLRGLGLLYQGMTFSGAVGESLVDDIRRRVEVSGGGMLAT